MSIKDTEIFTGPPLNDTHSESDLQIRNFNQDQSYQQIENDDLMGTETLSRAVSGELNLHDEESLISKLTTEDVKESYAFKQISKFNWFDSDFKRTRAKVYLTFGRNYLILCVTLICVLSIYWGSYYNRPSRYVNFKMLLLSDDQEVNGILPIVGNSLGITSKIPEISKAGGWIIANATDFAQQAELHNNSIVEEIKEQVHHQEYWAIIYANPNSTYQLYDAIINDQPFNISNNLVEVYFETGRDLSAVSSYVVTFIRAFESGYQDVFKAELPSLISELPTDSDKVNALNYISQPFLFKSVDMLPITGSILLAPFELGLTYLVVFAFFQTITTIKLQTLVASYVKGLKFIALRTLICHISYAVISLGYVLLNVGFQIDYTITFGKSGALVLWSIGYLTMASLSTINDCVAILCYLYYPALIGAWLVLLMVFNVAPTLSVMELTNHFYRYGYAMPIYNSYQLVKVVFCNSYKGYMGRHFGILIAWVCLGNLLLPLVLVHASKVRAKQNSIKVKSAAATNIN